MTIGISRFPKLVTCLQLQRLIYAPGRVKSGENYISYTHEKSKLREEPGFAISFLIFVAKVGIRARALFLSRAFFMINEKR